MSSSPDTTGITDLISQFPIFSSLIRHLDIWDLIQLSRTSSAIRYLCHRFDDGGSFGELKHVSGTKIRKSLKIGQHRTPTWKLYKGLAQKRCRELDHTRGLAPLGCKLCSKPVCFACIVKHSFNKHENTFLLRGRTLCKKCFNSGNPHSEHISIQGSSPMKISYTQEGLCVCTSQDGILCSDCKKKQNQDSLYVFKRSCAGTGCDQLLEGDAIGARVCLWCDSILPTTLSKLQYETSHGLPPMEDDLLSVRGVATISTARGTPFRSLHNSTNHTPSPNRIETQEPLIGTNTQHISLIRDAEIPPYSQYPVDRAPDYHSSHVQVQE